MNIVVVISQQLPKIIFAVVSALLAYQLALLTWAIYPVEESSYRWAPPAKGARASVQQLNTQKLQDLSIFGLSTSAPDSVSVDKIEAVDDAEVPKTRLNVNLVGIVAASKPEYSSVIIEYRGQQDSYFIDSMIADTNAKVSEIYSDRIILMLNGQRQILMLDGLEQDNVRMENIAKQQASEVIPRKSSTPVKEIALNRAELLTNPGKLTDFIYISPVREGSEIKGYRVNPGKSPELFKQAGLKAGDLVVELNGVDLTDMSKAMSLMKEFSTMKEISLMVDRDGQLNELFFSIP